MPDRVGQSEASDPIHLPAVIADEFGIPRSEARRRIALGRVKVNGQIVTDMDIDLEGMPDEVSFEVECRPMSDAICQMLQAQATVTMGLTDHSGDRLYLALALFDTRDGTFEAELVRAAREGYERSAPEMAEPDAWAEFDHLWRERERARSSELEER